MHVCTHRCRYTLACCAREKEQEQPVANFNHIWQNNKRLKMLHSYTFHKNKLLSKRGPTKVWLKPLLNTKKAVKMKRCYEYPPTGKAAVRASSCTDLGESKQDLPKGNQAPSDLPLTGPCWISNPSLSSFDDGIVHFCPLTLGEKKTGFFSPRFLKPDELKPSIKERTRFCS